MKRVTIIGAGIGGLATANLLAAKGYTVDVYEQHDIPGGRAGTKQIKGFTFDTGPSWYLMPEVFERYYSLLNETLSEHLELVRLDPAYKVFFETAEPVEIHADIDRDTQTFESIEPGAGAQLGRYLAKSEQIYKLALKHFLYTTFEKPLQLVKPEVIRHAPTMLRSALEPIDRYVSRYFSDQRLKQIVEYPMVFLGTSPYEAPSLYSLMSHMDFTQGVFYPQRGIYSIIDSLISISKKHGVTIHTDTPVASIDITNGVASGITLGDGSHVAADIVISNADLHFTETALIDRQHQSYPASYWERKQPSPSAILLYLGVRGELPQLQHHNLLFTSDWKTNFGDIFEKNTWPTPASMYICNPSKTDPSVAPQDQENLFVLIPGPARTDNSPEEIERLADEYLDQIAVMIDQPDLRERLVVKELMSPHDFEQRLGTWRGSALGMSHVLTQSAFFRPKNKSKKVSNLYYVGGNVAPGIGLPMCLIGAELVSDTIEKDMA